MTVVLEDFEGNQSRDPLVIEVRCPSGSEHPICYVEPVIEEPTIITDTTGTTTTTTTAPTLSGSLSSATADEFFDYEEVEILSLTESVEPVNLDLEDDPDFVDEPGIVTEE